MTSVHTLPPYPTITEQQDDVSMLTAPMHYRPPQKTGKLTPTELEEFLRQPWNARLATVTPQGRPYVAPVWFAYEAEKRLFYVVGRERAAYIEHILHNAAVALHIADDVHLEHTRVLVEGDAQLRQPAIAPAEDAWLGALVNDMATRYMGPDGPRYAVRTFDRPRVLITITPQKIQSWTGGEWAERYWRSPQS
jgi:nitroimidazol reductase NimA-like FMN-containing flavoprotein (pyridoxamine 5'-phosphate oxidase superfamily)